MSFADYPIELIIRPDEEGIGFRLDWHDGEPVHSNLIRHIPYLWLDLIPFLGARVLLSMGYDPDRAYIVNLQGADFEVMRSTLGAVAATPTVNAVAPVREPERCIYCKGDRERAQRARGRIA